MYTIHPTCTHTLVIISISGLKSNRKFRFETIYKRFMSVSEQQIKTIVRYKYVMCSMQPVSVYIDINIYILRSVYIYKCLSYLNNTVHQQCKQF